MAADPTQSTLYLSLPESAAIAAATDPQNISLIRGGNGPGAISLTGGTDVFAYIIYAGVADADGMFVPKSELIISEFTAASSADYSMRTAVSGAATLVYGGCPAPAFTMRQCKGCVVNNNNNATIYIRRGTANEAGLTIAKPGDSDGDNVQGIPIYAYGQFIINDGEWEPGAEIHLLGTAANQTATVAFI